MIHFDLVYYRPDTIDEAVAAFQEAASRGLDPLYLGGGTEITTFGRQGKIRPGALIDLKRIPECASFGIEDGRLAIGAAVPLNRVVDDPVFPALAEVCASIADRTVRNRLTVGGNIAGRLSYREAVLPFLLCDAQFDFAGPSGRRSAGVHEAFQGRLRLQAGEFLVAVRVPERFLRLPCYHRRRERSGRVDYPLVSMLLSKIDGTIRCAVSGFFATPQRLEPGEFALSDSSAPAAERAVAALESLSEKVRDDFRASADYRKHLFGLALAEGLSTLEG